MIPIRNVRSVLYATAILFLIAVLGLRAAFLAVEQRNALARAEAATQDLALLMEEYTKRTFETSDLLLVELSNYVRARGGVEVLRGDAATYKFLVDLTRKSSASDLFLITDNTGKTVAASTGERPPPIDFSDRAWFRAHLAGAETFVGGATMGRIAKEILYTYSRRIPTPDGGFEGVAEVALRPSFLNDLARPNISSSDVTLGIWSREGHVIARTGLTPDEIGFSLARTTLFNERRGERLGTYRATDEPDGVERIVSFRRLEQWPVTVTASIPVDAALSGWRSSLYWSGAITIFMFFAVGWLTWLGMRLTKRTEETQKQLEHVNRDLAQANDSLGQALSDKVMLLQEIHHRVKNNLQVTSSLLQMQAARFTDPSVRAAFQDTQDRLGSIGLIHDLLYRRDSEGMIDLRDYLDRLIQELSATYGAEERGIAISLDAEPISINLDRGTPLTLAVTEAVINAFKHAFAPGQGGRICVKARQINGQIEITVQDNGQGLVKPSEDGTSLGMKLIRAFSNQLGGTFSFEGEGGTTFRLQVPA